MRAEEKDGNMIGRKVATATLSKAKIQATIGTVFALVCSYLRVKLI